MNFWFDVHLAYQNLLKNKVRTLLSVTGITIGIGTIILVMSIGASARELILGQISSIGADNLFIEIKVPLGKETSNAAAIAQGVVITTMKPSDAIAVAELPNVKETYGGITGQAVLTHLDKEQKALFFAATEKFLDISNYDLARGRFFTDQEDRSMSRVIVLGYGIAQDLFGDSDPIGVKIGVNGQRYRVIGVVSEQGTQFFNNVDQQVYFPLKTAQKQLLGVDHILFIGLKIIDTTKIDSTVASIRELLRKRHQIKDPTKEDFAVRTFEEAMNILGGVTTGISVLLILVGGISLIVGGVGIMNIMYVSVTERIKEIGLLKAVGAPRISILRQFIFEAILITLFGAMVGIAGGLGISALIAYIAQSQDYDWPLVFSLNSIIVACLSSGTIGIIFGYYPARKAADLHPIEALRTG